MMTKSGRHFIIQVIETLKSSVQLDLLKYNGGTCFQMRKIKNIEKINAKLKILKRILQIIFSFPVTGLDLSWIQGILLLIGTENRIEKNICLKYDLIFIFQVIILLFISENKYHQ